MDILQKIDSMRLERGWSINYLALEAELTQSTLNNLYTRKSEPKLSTLRSICNAFGITLADFFREETDDNDELLRRVTSLSPKNRAALLQLLRNMKP